MDLISSHTDREGIVAIVMRVQKRTILFNLRVILVSLFILASGLGYSTSWAFGFESKVAQSPLSLVKKDLRAQFIALAEKNKLKTMNTTKNNTER